MSKKVNVMLTDVEMGLIQAEFADTDGAGLFAREYTSGGLLISNDKGNVIADYKGNEWVAYAVEKGVEE